MRMILGSVLALICHSCAFPRRVLGQVLRLILVLTSGPLFLPLCNGLARVFTCAPNTDWLHTTLPCYGPAHSALVIGGGALLVALWALVFAGAPMGTHPTVHSLRLTQWVPTPRFARGRHSTTWDQGSY
jgi:hypothetical protein